VKGDVVFSQAGVQLPAARDFLELTKPRITLLVTLTAAVGYFMGSRTGLAGEGLLFLLLGTVLVAGGANVLNQVLERDADARMVRTRERPLPAGRVTPNTALAFGTILGLGGILLLALTLNLTAAVLAGLTLASYVFVYTPLKRVTSLNTLVGAVPGALPPLGGWAAAAGYVPREAWLLFLIVFLWQVPHFLAIAWILRDDYLRGGFRMLTVSDTDGVLTGRHITLGALALLPVSLAPTLLGLTGDTYFFGALILGISFAGLSLYMARRPTVRRAKRLFLGSVLYLPALLAVMMVDKLPG
jgi:protoheme IX farnesyltransferase